MSSLRPLPLLLLLLSFVSLGASYRLQTIVERDPGGGSEWAGEEVPEARAREGGLFLKLIKWSIADF